MGAHEAYRRLARVAKGRASGTSLVQRPAAGARYSSGMADGPPSDSGGRRTRDLYGRRTTSRSRGRTDERIMALQHRRGVLPGAQELLADPQPGSIGAALTGFHREWVEQQAVTSRRTYERALVLLARDLAANGPALDHPVRELDQARLATHLAWRADNGLRDSAELVRASVHLARLADWLDTTCTAQIGASREVLREVAVRLAGGPPGTGR